VSFLLWHRDGDVGIASTRRVFSAAEVPLFKDANDLCRRLQALHSEMAARVAAACEEARQSGYAAGLREGAQAAAEEHATRLASLALAAARHRDAIAAQVAGLALQVARKMIGSLADDERLLALASTAARELLPEAQATVLVHPDRADAVRDLLCRLAADDGNESRVAFDVRADPGSGVEGCRIETELGSVDATLDTQLRRLAAAWQVPADWTDLQ
jgi:flagellar biosynthesis/type III secretory pathway protein FliH